ncbi:2554_t:CDS:1, partial [Funneliformis mosseae]
IKALQVTSTIASIMDEESKDTEDEALIFESDDKAMTLQSKIVTFSNILKAQIYDLNDEDIGIDPFED